MGTTRIEWCNKSWNVITGCSHAGSPGCDNCYARRMAYRLKGRYGYPKDDPFKVTFHPDRLEEPLHWKKPSQIFVCSMGDLFHGDVKFDWQLQTWLAIEHNPRHTFMILTKRPEKMKKFFDFLFRDPVEKTGLRQPFNLWLGVSVENQQTADERIPILLQIPAAKKFISCEPLLEEIDLIKASGCNYPNEMRKLGIGFDWCIVGGETGPKARPLHPDWIRSLVGQCRVAGVPFFFKSWGEWLPVGQKPASEFKPIGKNDAIKRFHLWEDSNKNVSMKIGHKAAGRLLDGKVWEEIPK